MNMKAILGAALLALIPAATESQQPVTTVPDSPDLRVTAASVQYDSRLDQFVFELTVAGRAGRVVPKAKGGMDGAPVLGYVFPTTLRPEDVGFSATDGIVALAATAHPDFDDTPLWDENGDRKYDNDGITWHTHWVVLVKDQRVAGGLAVKEFRAGDKRVVLPPTNPGMPMYMDSPGFSAVTRGNKLRVPVPGWRMSNKRVFRFDAVAAYMQVSTTGDRPMLGVYKVYSVLSKNLSLPYRAR